MKTCSNKHNNHVNTPQDAQVLRAVGVELKADSQVHSARCYMRQAHLILEELALDETQHQARLACAHVP